MTDIGVQFRRAREAAGVTQRALAARAKMRPAQLSLLECGYNVEGRFYARVARVLGFRGALELLRHHDDALTRTMLRLWYAMDDDTRAVAARKLRVWLLED